MALRDDSRPMVASVGTIEVRVDEEDASRLQRDERAFAVARIARALRQFETAMGQFGGRRWHDDVGYGKQAGGETGQEMLAIHSTLCFETIVKIDSGWKTEELCTIFDGIINYFSWYCKKNTEDGVNYNSFYLLNTGRKETCQDLYRRTNVRR